MLTFSETLCVAEYLIPLKAKNKSFVLSQTEFYIVHYTVTDVMVAWSYAWRDSGDAESGMFPFCLLRCLHLIQTKTGFCNYSRIVQYLKMLNVYINLSEVLDHTELTSNLPYSLVFTLLFPALFLSLCLSFSSLLCP